MESGPEDNQHDHARRTLVGAVAAIILVLLGVYVMVKFKQSSELLDCIAAGHHNCTPAIDTSAPR